MIGSWLSRIKKDHWQAVLPLSLPLFDQLMDARFCNRRITNPPHAILDTAVSGRKRVYSDSPTVGHTCRINGVLQLSPESHNDLY